MTLKPKMGRAESSFDCLTLQSIFLLHWQEDLLYGTAMIAGVEARAGHLTGRGYWPEDLEAPLLGYFPLLYDYFLRLLWTTETTCTSTFGYLLSISLPFFYLLMDISGGELLELKELLLIGDLYHLTLSLQ